MEVFKIKNKDENFSSGGMSPYWKKRGKSWNSKQAVSGHLGLLLLEGSVKCYLNNGVTLICMSENGIKEEPIEYFILDKLFTYKKQNKLTHNLQKLLDTLEPEVSKMKNYGLDVNKYWDEWN